MYPGQEQGAAEYLSLERKGSICRASRKKTFFCLIQFILILCSASCRLEKESGNNVVERRAKPFEMEMLRLVHSQFCLLEK